MNTSPSDTTDPWLIARQQVTALGRIPPVFTLAIRSLISDHTRGLVKLSPASTFLVNRLLLSPTMKSVVYHSVLTFHSEKVTSTPHISSADLVRLFTPGDLASLIATAFFFRMFKRILSTLGEESAWMDLENRIHKEVDLAGFVGSCIPHIGAGTAIASRGFPFLAQSFFLIMDAKKASPYVSNLCFERPHPDFQKELDLFGCTSAQLASSMMQAIGFGMPMMNAALTAYAHLDDAARIERSKDPYHLRMHFTHVWVETLTIECAEPKFKMPADFYPTKQDLFRLLYLAGELQQKGPKYSWCSRGKEDISPALTPQLYQEFLAESASAEELTNFCESNLPPELLAEIPAGDLEALTKRDPTNMDF